MKALVVDDSRAMRMVLVHILKDFGFQVSEAGHGKDALAHLQQHTDTKVALIDWNMPEMTGIELLGALRSDSRFDGLKRVMVTTESEAGQLTRAIEQGASEYVMKPFTKAIIEEKLRLIGLL
jgi:two-component system chemotaxis response regulator CheY